MEESVTKMSAATEPVPAAKVQAFGLEDLRQLYEALGAEAHPVLRLPALAQVRAMLARPRGKDELIKLLRARQERIALAETAPLWWTFEPPTWADADRLLIEFIILAIFGGNRAQKTWYAICRAAQLADLVPRGRLAVMSESEISSITTVQALFWHFIRPKYGHLNGKRDAVMKIAYNQANGFSERKVILPNGTEVYFLTYNQNPGDYEGWEFGAPAEAYAQTRARLAREGGFCPANVGAVADESMPLAWLQMLGRRLKFRQARLLWPFTPAKGMTPAVKELAGGAVTVESRESELLPRQNLPDLPKGHMPYIARCGYAGARAAAIYFHTRFNPFGPAPGRTYYDEIRELCQNKSSEYVERVAYGYARDNAATVFRNFGTWNIVQEKDLPAVGTNYLFIDPAGARNWAMLWVRVTPGDKPSLYVYREWPDAQTYGEWAVATERETNDSSLKGWDGDAGPAQNSLGFGITQYKALIREKETLALAGRPYPRQPTPMELTAWLTREFPDPYRRRLAARALARGAAEVSEAIAERYIDPRAGRNEHIAEQGGTCLIEDFESDATGPGMELLPASGVHLDEGLTEVNELLAWNRERPLQAITNCPRLFIAENCLQTLWMFGNYTGRGGEKGACKDWADLARYMALARLEHTEGVVTGKPGGGF